jgi:hypothetical protein
MEMEAFDPLSQLPGIRAKPGFFSILILLKIKFYK